MSTPYPLTRLFSLLFILFCFVGCVKTDPGSLLNPPPPPPGSNPPPVTQLPPAITPVGIPVGSVVTKTIGSGGGSIVSDDSIISLNIPAGALSSNTQISIQSVTNETPGGIGLSYHLMPDGTKFSKPATLVFHYTDRDVNGSHPYLMFVAYQDSTYAWKADLKNRDVDTIAKTVSEEISHFSVWTVGESLLIITDNYDNEVYKNQTINIKAYQTGQATETTSTGGDDDLPSLPQSQPLSAERVSNWKVNGQLGGNSQDGTVSGQGGLAVYTAPAHIDHKRTVQVSVEYKDPLILFNHGRLIDRSSQFILFINITLLPSEFNYSVLVSFKDTYITGYSGQTYYDQATFDIYIDATDAKDGDGLTVILTNIQNQGPSVTPAQHTVANTTPPITFTWHADNVGEINVVAGSAILQSEGVALIHLLETGTLAPHFSWVAGTLTGDLGGVPIDGVPTDFMVNLDNSSQPQYPNGQIETGSLIKVTPKPH